VLETRGAREALCQVVTGGILAAGKGVNLPHTELKLSAVTQKDRRDVAWLGQQDVDYVGLSFIRTAADVQELRGLLDAAGSSAQIVAKVEKPQAVDRIEEILAAADAVMVARGDLGVEMDLPTVPVAQKRIARLCHAAGKVCIIATQMLESMTGSPTPTRAEASDVANAVLDLTDAVMLSGETAVGKYPVESVAMMNCIVQEIQAYHDETYTAPPVAYQPAATAAALAGAVRKIIEAEDITAVAVFSVTGTTARLFAKNRLPVPVLALSPDARAVRRMCLYYGVLPVRADAPEHTRDVLKLASDALIQKGIVQQGQKIIVVSGRPIFQPGTANTIVVHTVGKDDDGSDG